ncbi:MAG: metal-dependent transcriptional regulator [Dehalococcoidia bacterium]|nr:metal-dependent transcriptional regulator [Dehalococcoidia bacterium]
MTGRSDDRPTPSLEDYLEAIAELKAEGGKATVTALGKVIGVKKPSVHSAMKKLVEAGLVTHEKYGDVRLTPAGARIADEVCRRHKALLSFLANILMVDPTIAEQDACKMEHALSEESIHRLEKYISFVRECYPGSPEWGDIFDRYVDQGRDERTIPDGDGVRH